MPLRNLALLVLVVCGISVGQLFFKAAAMRASAAPGSFAISLSKDYVFLIALCVYAVSTFLWVYVLSNTKLSIAYPFMAVSFVTTPLLASKLFSETLDRRYWIGLAVIIAGILIMPRK